MNRFPFSALAASAALALAPAAARAAAGPFDGVRQDDLAPGVGRTFEDSSSFFYALPAERKTDLYVLLLRSDLLKDPNAGAPVKALISIGSVVDRPDCGVLRAKLGKERLEDARKRLDGKFYCFDTSLTVDAVVAANPLLAKDSVNTPPQVDAHMGWYSATGSAAPVNKLVHNLAENNATCPCIGWPLTSVRRFDTLFARHVREAAKRYPRNQIIREVLADPEPAPAR